MIKTKAESIKELKTKQDFLETTAESSSDLQHHHEEEVEIGHSLELFKQCHGQESQGGVLVAADNIVLATDTNGNREGERERRAQGRHMYWHINLFLNATACQQVLGYHVEGRKTHA